MININVLFLNYSYKKPDGSPLKYHFNKLGYDLINDASKPPDIIMSSVYGNLDTIEKHPRSIKILLSNENLYHTHYNHITDRLYLFDYFIGYCNYNKLNNWYKIPSFYQAHAIYSHNKRYQQIVSNTFNNNKNRNICLVARNPEKTRLQILNRLLSKKISVDCPGKVGKNMSDIGPSWDDKIDFLSKYYFNICPENSYLEDYITEKLLHASLANCIPIYWGCEHLEYGVYNKDKILLINKNKSNLNSIMNEIEWLINHPQDMKEKSLLPPFNTNIFIEQINTIDASLLELCTKIIERIK